MSRKRSNPSNRNCRVYERHFLDRRKGILLQREIRFDEQGAVLRYSLTYIDPTLYAGDNGRVLGYDNDHGHHHRHCFGETKPVRFTTFEVIEKRFEREFWEIYNEYHGKKRNR